MTDHVKRGDDSLVPVEVDERLSIEQEAELAGKRHGRPVALYAVLAALAIAAGLLGMRALQAGPDHAAAAAAIDADVEAQLGAFNSCAFSGLAADQLKLGVDVQVAAENFGSRYGSGYAQRLRKCVPRLGKLTTSLEQTPVAPELQPTVAAIAGATVQLAEAWTAYRDYLEQGRFDTAGATPYAEAIGGAVTRVVDSRAELAGFAK